APAYALAADLLFLALRDALTEKLDIPIHDTPSRPGTATLEPGHTRHSMMSRLRRPRPARAVSTGG
ncbi:SGNH/GDSL hydrolase family protein, partial [Mycobacterium tuberculosis]